MIVPVMAISNLVLTRQIYSEGTNGAHAHYREPVPLILDNNRVSGVLLIDYCNAFDMVDHNLLWLKF